MLTAKMVYKGLFEFIGHRGERTSHFNEGMKRGMEAAGKYWRKNILPGHFTISAFGKYGYAHRTWKYEKRKFEKYGHKRPLVYSGTLEEAINRYGEVDAWPARVKVRMKGPKWLKGYTAFRGRTGTGPDKTKEIKRVLDQEGEMLSGILKTEVAKYANELKRVGRTLSVPIR